MKTEDLKLKGLTQEQIDFVMSEYGKEINPIKSERDTYKEQLSAAQTALKGFEGVDVGKLQDEVKKLSGDLAAKETEMNTKIADMQFDSILNEVIRKNGARNEKAVMAMLEIDKLKASKNQNVDIEAALAKVKSENDYLFQSDKPIPRVVSSTPGPNEHVDDAKSKANEALRSLFGKE